jgi:antitoxin ParD1/3/4
MYLNLNTGSKMPTMRLVTVKLPDALVEGMDELISAGMYPSRSAVVRAAVRDLVRNELWRPQQQSR